MNKIQAPSGEKRGNKSGPSDSAVSLPFSTCLSQMRGTPSRSEIKATVRPSGETLGSESRPEYVMLRKTGGSGTGCGKNHPIAQPNPIAGKAQAAILSQFRVAARARCGSATPLAAMLDSER